MPMSQWLCVVCGIHNPMCTIFLYTLGFLTCNIHNNQCHLLWALIVVSLFFFFSLIGRRVTHLYIKEKAKYELQHKAVA
jgi:hypothetical protein